MYDFSFRNATCGQLISLAKEAEGAKKAKGAN